MKVLIIHHDDADGRVGGFIMHSYYVSKGYEVECFEANYDTEFVFSKLVAAGDKVCIVDFSLNNEYMTKLLEIVSKSDITWIDHHKSAIETYTNQSDLDGIRYIGYSGCELAYIYSKGYRQKHDDKFVNIENNPSNDGYEFIDIDQIEIDNSLVKYVGAYDVWREEDPNYEPGRALIFGLDAIWPKLKLTDPNGIKLWESLYTDYNNFLESMVSTGKTIFQYALANYEETINEYGFEVSLHKFEDLKAIAVNANSRGSLIFTSVRDKYEIGITFGFKFVNNKKSMVFGIYRLNLNPDKKIDCSDIAKSYGGGGHPDASGFSTSGTLPFKF